MDPFAKFNGHTQPSGWLLDALSPTPDEEWLRIRNFLGLSKQEIDAMLATVEPLFRRGPELVVDTYDYLLANPETAAILGWERGADPDHLAERRRFFTVWLARLLGMDFSNDLATYLFRAGTLHAGHGPRKILVDPVFVTGSISLVHATFARFLDEEMPGTPQLPAALAGWNKVLTMHLHLMQMGQRAAQNLDSGEHAVAVTFFGNMRKATKSYKLDIHVTAGAIVSEALRKLFNYFPTAREDVFDIEWREGERVDSTGTPWFEPERIYRVKPMWRVLLNGKDLTYIGGPTIPIGAGDELQIFPPGR